MSSGSSWRALYQRVSPPTPQPRPLLFAQMSEASEMKRTKLGLVNMCPVTKGGRSAVPGQQRPRAVLGGGPTAQYLNVFSGTQAGGHSREFRRKKAPTRAAILGRELGEKIRS